MLGAELRRLRRGTLDLTQEELAAKLKLSARTISAYENEEQPIPFTVELALQRLATLS
jgi:transcriptional regulator with XRE-family HTH domain